MPLSYQEAHQYTTCSERVTRYTLRRIFRVTHIQSKMRPGLLQRAEEFVNQPYVSLSSLVRHIAITPGPGENDSNVRTGVVIAV